MGEEEAGALMENENPCAGGCSYYDEEEDICKAFVCDIPGDCEVKLPCEK